MYDLITHSVPFMSLSIFGLLEIALWGVPGPWDEASALLWSCAHSPASVSGRLVLVCAEHLASFGPLFSFQASWDDTIFPALHCLTTQWGGCYVRVVPSPDNSVGHHGGDQGVYKGCRPSTPPMCFNYKDLELVVLRCYCEFFLT